MADELIPWLRAQLDEDERVAREAQPGYWLIGRTVEPGSDRGQQETANRRYLARYDPARLLADVMAKRRILGNCEEIMNGTGWPGLAQVIVRLLAMPYADREGYRAGWRI